VLSFSALLSDALASPAESQTPGEVLMSGSYKQETSSSLLELLESTLARTNTMFVRVEPATNNGEHLSVRYATWLLDLDALPKAFPDAWKLLEVAPYSEVYCGGNADALLDAAIVLKSNELVLDKDSDDPLPYRRCPICGSDALKRASLTGEKETYYFINCECGWGDRS
jgi:hypothetical protein